jgi:hypothetical protein
MGRGGGVSEIEAKAKPIIFSGESVRAILEGRKTQTRRPVNPQPVLSEGQKPYAPEPRDHSPGLWVWMVYNDRPGYRFATQDRICRYGVPGDRLWVRETWARNENQLSDERMDRCVIYRANGNGRAADNGTEKPWHSPMHMPRWASRITLEITGVRVERLQEISEHDAEAEGVSVSHYYCEVPTAELDGVHRCDPVGKFRELWDSINGKRGGGAYAWERNPWVWVVEFRRTG